jgi:uncharacterized protein with NRDE domain
VETTCSSLIALSNRDEFLDRPTASAHFWPDPHNEVLAPCDLARDERGTWIGVSKSGKFAALLNFHEEDSAKVVGEISRGKFPKDFLASAQPTIDWIRKTRASYGDTLEKAGGFTLVCGEVHSDNVNLSLFSNRPNNKDQLFGEHEKTVCISNALMHQEWPKVELGKKLLTEAIDRSMEENWTQDVLIEHLFGILSTDTYPRESSDLIHDLRKSIFIPKIPLKTALGEAYGTRTQTVILVKRSGEIKYIEKNVLNGATEDFSLLVN